MSVIVNLVSFFAKLVKSVYIIIGRRSAFLSGYFFRSPGVRLMLPSATSWHPSLCTSPSKLFPFGSTLRISSYTSHVHCIAAAENIAYGMLPALVYLLVPALIIINAWRSVRVKVKGKSYHPDATACLPAFMQALYFDVTGLNIINLAEMIPCVLRNSENVNQRLVVTVLIPRLAQILIIKLLMFLVCKKPCVCRRSAVYASLRSLLNKCHWHLATLPLTLCCSCVNRLLV